jgi:hypothetical protein
MRTGMRGTSSVQPGRVVSGVALGGWEVTTGREGRTGVEADIGKPFDKKDRGKGGASRSSSAAPEKRDELDSKARPEGNAW